jgi:hypothetical protein
VPGPFSYCGHGTAPDGLGALGELNANSVSEFEEDQLADILSGDCEATSVSCDALDIGSIACNGPGTGPFNFGSACARHDVNYRVLKALDVDGSTWNPQNRAQADLQFLEDMLELCSGQATNCEGLARVYFDGVRVGGNGLAGWEIVTFGPGLALRWLYYSEP